MTSLLKHVLNRYGDMSDEEQYDFRISLRNFNKWHAYIIQVARMFDKELYQEYVFTSYLDKSIKYQTSLDN